MKQLRVNLFRKTAIAPGKKLQVAGSLRLSRETYACGTFPILNSCERRKLHTNVLLTYREVLCGNFDPDQQRLSDTDLLHVHGVRAPYVLVRFARLSLSIRAACKASFAFHSLLFACRFGKRSWLHALESDLKWMQLCDSTTSFTVTSWFVFAREAPKAARALVRKLCDSSEARSLSLGETSSAI